MHSKKLFISNLKYGVNKEELVNLLSPYGEVIDVKIIDGRGFGFVEMSSQIEAENAKDKLNNSEYQGRTIRVNEAQPHKKRPHFRRH